jgi:hypothetical protein
MMSRRPRTLRYREALDTAEQRIVDALPEIIDVLINRAKEGDTKAAVNLVDRMLGKAARATSPPADDKRPLYTNADFKLEVQKRESNSSLGVKCGSWFKLAASRQDDRRPLFACSLLTPLYPWCVSFECLPY